MHKCRYISYYVLICTQINHRSQSNRFIQLTIFTVIVNKWVVKTRTAQQFATHITGICHNRNAFTVCHFGFDHTRSYLWCVGITTHTTTSAGYSAPSACSRSRLQFLSWTTFVKARTDLYTCVDIRLCLCICSCMHSCCIYMLYV